MERRLSCLALTGLLIVVAACSGGEDDESAVVRTTTTTTVADTYRTVFRTIDDPAADEPSPESPGEQGEDGTFEIPELTLEETDDTQTGSDGDDPQGAPVGAGSGRAVESGGSTNFTTRPTTQNPTPTAIVTVPRPVPVPVTTTPPTGSPSSTTVAPATEPGPTTTTEPTPTTQAPPVSSPGPTTTLSVGPEVEPEPEPEQPPVAVAEETAFTEGEALDWLMYEQVAEARASCYETGIAAAAIVDVDGVSALALTANAAGTTRSNHALLGKQVSSATLPRTVHSVELRYLVSPDPDDLRQTGPEFSVQMTSRMADGRYLTAMFGLQHDAVSNEWQLLQSGLGGESWSVVHNSVVESGTWYTLRLTFDTLSMRYVALENVGPNGFSVEVDDVETAWRDKGVQGEATWLTLDAENLFTCDEPAVATTTAYYESVAFVTG